MFKTFSEHQDFPSEQRPRMEQQAQRSCACPRTRCFLAAELGLNYDVKYLVLGLDNSPDNIIVYPKQTPGTRGPSLPVAWDVTVTSAFHAAVLNLGASAPLSMADAAGNRKGSSLAKQVGSLPSTPASHSLGPMEHPCALAGVYSARLRLAGNPV